MLVGLVQGAEDLRDCGVGGRGREAGGIGGEDVRAERGDVGVVAEDGTGGGEEPECYLEWRVGCK